VGGLLDGSKADERPPRRRRKLKPYPTYYDLLCAARPIDADGKPLPLSKAAQAASYCDIRIAGKVYCSPYVRVDIWRATRSAHEREAFRADFARGRDHQITFAPKSKRCPRWYAFDGNKRQGFSWLQQSAVSNEAIERSDNRRKPRRRRISFLKPEQQEELCKRLEAGDIAARNEIAAAYLPMVIRISKERAKKFNCPINELVQVAICGNGALGTRPYDGVLYSLSKYRQSDGALPPYLKRHGLNGRTGQTLTDIGRDLGISGERVRQVELRIQTMLATVLTQAVQP
jgi:hypothetical protein